MDLTKTKIHDLAVAAILTAEDGPLDGAKIRLFTNDVNPDFNSVEGDFEDTTYTGHADKAVTWLAPAVADDGAVEIPGSVAEFRPTDAVTPNDVFGALLINADGEPLAGGRFEDGPLPMQSAMDSILMMIRYRVQDGSAIIVLS